MPYEVQTFIGDFPLAGQPNWDITFDTLEVAIKAAKDQHTHFKTEDCDEHYTIVIDLDKDTEDEVMWIMYKDEIKEGMKAQEIADTLAYGECP
jgi:hypothetical protein